MSTQWTSIRRARANSEDRDSFEVLLWTETGDNGASGVVLAIFYDEGYAQAWAESLGYELRENGFARRT